MDCVICGKPAGFFKRRHVECALAQEREAEKQRHEAAALATERHKEANKKELLLDSLRADVYETLRTGGDMVGLDKRLADAVADHGLSFPEKTQLLVSGYEKCVDAFLNDGLLDADEEARLVACQERFDLSQETLDRNGKYMKVGKAAVLRRVMEGNVPENVAIEGGIPVNFQRGEKPVWVFNRCQYLEDIVRRQIVGRSQGMSFRVMSGVYYRVGGFKGEPVMTTERKNLGAGMLVVTEKNLYFVGPGKTTRIPYAKVVSFTPYSDAVGVMRDAATAKPQFFVVDDPWFAFNLITNLAQIHS